MPAIETLKTIVNTWDARGYAGDVFVDLVRGWSASRQCRP